MPIGGGHSVLVQREWAHQPWGLRIVGGCDLNKPLVIIRVASGSPAERSVKSGDVILQIEDYDARDLRHQDALMLFQKAAHQIKLVIQREGAPIPPPPKDWSSEPMGIPLPQTVLDHREPIAAPLFLNSALIDSRPLSASPNDAQQPYRTTPLVLPGAKARREFHPNESYLRHHPNPMFRQAPSHPLLTHEVAMKQKVADTVLQKVEQDVGGKQLISHKQFNSPLALYSEQNIVDTIAGQTGASMPPRKTVQYDPSKSETYKALQDQEIGPNVHEVTPIVPKVFSPIKQTTPPPNVKPAQPHPVPGPHVNSVGHIEEIQQSHTFKRLMHMVQNEGVY